MIKSFILIIIILLFPILGYGETLSVKLYYVPGANGVSLNDAMYIYDEARRKVETRTLRLRISRVEELANPFPSLTSVTQTRATIDAWINYFRTRESNRRVLKLIILPPFNDSGTLYLAGYSSGTCAYAHFNPVAFSNAEYANQNGEPRISRSITAMAHEIGHLLGARHYNNHPNIMHEDALGLTDPNTPNLNFSSLSRRQILRCL